MEMLANVLFKSNVQQVARCCSVGDLVDLYISVHRSSYFAAELPRCSIV